MTNKTQTKRSGRLELNRELLIGSLTNSSFAKWYNQYVQNLPQYIDDVECDFGVDLYAKMMNDPAVQSCINQIVISVLAAGATFQNPIDPPSDNGDADDIEYQKAEEIREFVEGQMSNLQDPLDDIIGEMLEALVYGHKLAEKTYRLDGGKYVLDKLRVKPRKSYSFVVDEFNDCVGVMGAKAREAGGSGLPVGYTSLTDVSEIIERDKFFLFTWRKQCGDPRGTSIIRSAYNAWYLKQQMWPQYLKYLAQFGTPSLAGILPPDADDMEIVDENGDPVYDDSGNIATISAAEAMLNKLVAFANGTAVVLEHGSDIKPIQSNGDGTAYTKAIDLFDRQITRAIMIAIRATMESEYGSRADSDTAQDIVGDFIQLVRRKIESAFNQDVIRQIVQLNYGNDALYMAPRLSLSDTNREDIASIGNMIANLARAQEGLIHHSQYKGIDDKLGLPDRNYEAQLEDMADKHSSEQMLWGLNPIEKPEKDGEELEEEEVLDG